MLDLGKIPQALFGKCPWKVGRKKRSPYPLISGCVVKKLSKQREVKAMDYQMRRI
jgi:hypothetical protein